MALDTYANLQTTIISWLKKAGLTTQVPDFIDLCEAKFNRALRLSTMETRVTATLDQQYENVPTDFLEMRSIQLTGSDGDTLEYVSPTSFNHVYRTSDTGIPRLYTIIDGTIGFAPSPSGSYTMEMVYYKKIPALSDSQTTNWMLTNHPDVYLYGSLAEAEAFLKNDPRIPVWKSLYEQAIVQIREADERERWPGPLTIRVQNLG